MERLSVAAKLGSSFEHQGASVTEVRALPRVGAHVVLEGIVVGEGLATDFANAALDMRLSVAPQDLGSGKASEADITGMPSAMATCLMAPQGRLGLGILPRLQAPGQGWTAQVTYTLH